ncbi:growth inhibitor PemK [Peptococcaceae bacterium SCADC1_2_3]|jgi:mRNA interferase MazF|nr:growth inhibitor PemK [Peptococcaceae bacterium SCADC1_2_3]
MQPSRGEVWLVDLNPVKGHEQAGKRPGLIVSVDLFNQGPSGLVIVLPITTKEKGIPFHVEINPPEGGLPEKSLVKCEDIRSISKERLFARLGHINTNTLAAIEDRLRILLDL